MEPHHFIPQPTAQEGTPMNVSIAERLATLRRQHGLTQEQLAQKLGVSRQAVSKWERTESSPDTDNLIALARLYGVTLDQLIYGEDAPADLLGPAEKPNPQDSDDAPGPSAADADNPAGEPAPADDSQDNSPDAENGDSRDQVHCSWDEGVHVDADDASVHVGWDGVRVHDYVSGDQVEVGPGGIHINATDGTHTVRTQDDGSVWIDDTRYDNWADAHRATSHDSKPKAFIARIPYAPLSLIALLGLGLFGQRWNLGWAFVAAIPAWESLCGVANAWVRGHRGKKLRGAVAGFCFWTGLSIFLITGALWGTWHPGWAWILLGLAASLLVDALWPKSYDS